MKISPFELQLAAKLCSKLASEMEQISADVVNLFEQMRQFADGNPAASEWLDFTKACMKKMGDIRDIETSDITTLDPINILELQGLLGRYRNARYLQMTQ